MSTQQHEIRPPLPPFTLETAIEIASATSMLKPGMKCALKAMISCCSVGREEYQPR